MIEEEEMKAKSSKRMAGMIIRSRKSIAKDGVVTVRIIAYELPNFYIFKVCNYLMNFRMKRDS